MNAHLNPFVYPPEMPMQTPAQAPSNPPIPALPAAPGAATGAQRAAQGAQQAAQRAEQVAQEAQRVAEQAQRIADQEIGRAVIAGQAPTPPPPPGELTTSTGLPVDPEAILRQATPIIGMTLAMVVVIFIGWPIARAIARRMDRRGEAGAVRAADLQPQIRQLQESLDAMAVELERISEAQRFQAKLMAERVPALAEGQKRS